MALVLGALLQLANAATLEDETLDRLNQIRNIRTGQSAQVIEGYNQQMDASWRFFTANKDAIAPTLRAQLREEMARPQPSDLLLLDIGYFLFLDGSAQDQALGLDALFRLNPTSGIATENTQQLFQFAHAAARLHDTRVLQLIDQAFLSMDQQIFIPQHALKLDSTLLCVFLYGAYGPEAEAALKARLNDKAVAQRALETLVWLGSPAALPEVRAALRASPDLPTVQRVTAYAMQAAGPEGRDFMLSLPAGLLDAPSKDYLSRVQANIRNTSFSSIHRSFERFSGKRTLPDAEVAARLEAMIENMGRDDHLNPLAILDSGLSTDVLLPALVKVRSRSLHRLSDEALDDVKVVNALMNGLRYRPK